MRSLNAMTMNELSNAIHKLKEALQAIENVANTSEAKRSIERILSEYQSELSNRQMRMF